MQNLAEVMESDFRTAKLGHTLSPLELEIKCKGVYGGVSWPNERPGFAVVIAMHNDEHLDNNRIYLLDEYESPRNRPLRLLWGASVT